MSLQYLQFMDDYKNFDIAVIGISGLFVKRLQNQHY